MTDLSKILVQEEEDIAETCTDHPDILASIHNNASMYMLYITLHYKLKKMVELINKIEQFS